MENRPKGKLVRLSEIKTNAQRRRRKDIAEQIACLKGAVHELDVIGYTVVFFMRDGGEACFWDTEDLGVAGPIRGELSKRALERVAMQRDVERFMFGDEE